jgi:hypothetical protein
VIDVAKFQNFCFTLVVVTAFIVLTCTTNAGKPVGELTIPAFSGTLLTLLGISHGGYLAGKLPDKASTPRGLTLDLERRGAVPVGSTGAVQGIPTYTPRNPRRP